MGQSGGLSLVSLLGMSLEESIQTYQELRKTSTWNQCWFPIFANGGGDFYAMNLAIEAHGEMIGYYINLL